MRRRHGVVARAPASRRFVTDACYAIVALPLAVAGFALVVVSTAGGLLLSVTLVGLPILGLGGLAARGLGSVNRALARTVLGVRVPEPPAFRSGRGFLGWLQSAVRDAPGWRCRAYLLTKLPLAAVTCYCVVVLGMALYWLTYPAWWRAAGTLGPLPPTGLDPQSWPGAVTVALIGAATILAGPWLLRALVALDCRLMRALLGPSAREERLRQLSDARAEIAGDAAAMLRRIERDLHDGTQAQLGSLAMNLGQAKEKLEHRPDVPYDPAGALALVDEAHRHAKDALVELRNIARGIHPPALDLGLDAALATLVARSAVPATLRVDLTTRPNQTTETITYFTAAELLANTAKHSRASAAAVEVVEVGGMLRLTVSDDGVGGARARGGSGLTGLANRLRAVDGHLDIASPPGGPTVITVDLPLAT